MQDDQEDGVVEIIVEIAEEIYLELREKLLEKLLLRVDRRGIYYIESDRLMRFFHYKCGHKDAPNFAIYLDTAHGEADNEVYGTYLKGDRMCIACAIKSLEKEAGAA